jgi:hypothetical protein
MANTFTYASSYPPDASDTLVFAYSPLLPSVDVYPLSLNKLARWHEWIALFTYALPYYFSALPYFSSASYTALSQATHWLTTFISACLLAYDTLGRHSHLPPKGRTCPQIMPATPFSLSHHQY